MQNKYINRSHILEKKFRKIIKYFFHDKTSHKMAIYTGISRNTVNKIFDKIRKRICSLSANSSKYSVKFELDKSYFGAKRVRGKRSRGAAGKTPIFGLLKRDGRVYVEIVKNCTRAQLLPIIQGKYTLKAQQLIRMNGKLMMG
jgi:transposase